MTNNGMIEGQKRKGLIRGKTFPLILREAFLPQFFAFNLLIFYSLFFAFRGFIKGFSPLRDAFSLSSLLFVFIFEF